MKRVVMALAIVCLLTARSASASSFLVNDSFETGNFTGWVTQDLSSPFFPLSVQATGAANSFGWPWSSTATDGNFVAFSGFDGDGPRGPNPIFIAQDTFVPLGTGTISFDWRAAWDLVTFCGQCQGSRTLDFQVQPTGGGASLLSVNILTAAPQTSNSDTGNQTATIDISAFAGQNVRLAWLMTIPENFTGPAQLQIDNIDSQTAVPEPATLLLVGSGALFARRRRKNGAAAL